MVRCPMQSNWGLLMLSIAYHSLVLCCLAGLAQLPIEDAHQENQHRPSEDRIAAADNEPSQLRESVGQWNPKNETTKNSEQGPEKDAGPPVNWYHDAMNVFTFIIALAAVLQLVVFITQALYMYWGLQETTKAANAAKASADAATAQVEHMRLEQRAWLSTSPPITISELKADEVAEASFGIKNTGLTPGTIVKRGFMFRLVPNNKEAIAQVALGVSQTTENMELVVPPDGVLRVPASGDVMTQTWLNSLAIGGATMVLAIWFEYVLATKGRGITQSVFIYNFTKKIAEADGLYSKMT